MEDVSESRPKRNVQKNMNDKSTKGGAPKKVHNPEECQIDTSSGGKRDGQQTKKKSNFALDNILIEKRDILRN
jgi:hypothetical protein